MSDLSGRVLRVDAAQIEGLTPGAIGRAGINAALRKLLVEADVEQIVIQGAVRTTGKGQGRKPDPSASQIEVEIAPGAGFVSPVSLATLLRDHGLGLAGGHAAVTEMAANGRVTVTLHVSDAEALLSRFAEMSVTARVAHHAVSG